MMIKELREKTTEELKDLLVDSQKKLRELRFKDSTNQLKSVRDVRKNRKLIAQILTLLNEKK